MTIIVSTCPCTSKWKSTFITVLKIEEYFIQKLSPCEYNAAYKLLDAVVVEPVARPLVHLVHYVQYGIRSQDFVGNVCTQEGVILISQYRRDEARHNCQSARKELLIYDGLYLNNCNYAYMQATV